MNDHRIARGTNLCAAGVLGVGLSIALPAVAQDQAPSAADVALARTLGLEGVKLADSGDCAGAIDKLQRAETLYHAPTILVRLGECQVALGKVVAGTEALQRVVREPLPPRPPPAFVAAQERAKKSLATALPKVAKLRIHLDVPSAAKPSVKLDGESISLATLDVDRPADPGNHALEATASGFRTATAQVTLGEGESGSATLKLEPDTTVAALPPAAPSGPVAAGAPAVGPASAQPQLAGASPGAPDAQGGGSKTAAYLVLGIGGAGLAVGSVLGLMAKSKASSLDGVCGSSKGECPALSQSDIDSMNHLATGSTIGFVLGGVGVGAGVILLFTSGSSTRTSGAASGGAFVRPWLGAASAGVSGAF